MHTHAHPPWGSKCLYKVMKATYVAPAGIKDQSRLQCLLVSSAEHFGHGSYAHTHMDVPHDDYLKNVWRKKALPRLMKSNAETTKISKFSNFECLHSLLSLFPSLLLSCVGHTESKGQLHVPIALHDIRADIQISGETRQPCHTKTTRPQLQNAAKHHRSQNISRPFNMFNLWIQRVRQVPLHILDALGWVRMPGSGKSATRAKRRCRGEMHNTNWDTMGYIICTTYVCKTGVFLAKMWRRKKWLHMGRWTAGWEPIKAQHGSNLCPQWGQDMPKMYPTSALRWA